MKKNDKFKILELIRYNRIKAIDNSTILNFKIAYFHMHENL